MIEKCYLKVKEIKQCCCNCIHHLPVHQHCITSNRLKNELGCCCHIQKGWACVFPEENRVYDNWPEHSVGCELYTPKTKKKK